MLVGSAGYHGGGRIFGVAAHTAVEAVELSCVVYIISIFKEIIFWVPGLSFLHVHGYAAVSHVACDAGRCDRLYSCVWSRVLAVSFFVRCESGGRERGGGRLASRIEPELFLPPRKVGVA